jgi:single stranded DNA-binding protein
MEQRELFAGEVRRPSGSTNKQSTARNSANPNKGVSSGPRDIQRPAANPPGPKQPYGYGQTPNPPQSDQQNLHPHAQPSHGLRDSHGVRLTGRIGRYFEVKSTHRGTPLAVFSVATNHPHRDESGNWTKKTVWHRIVVWGAAARALEEQLEKGARVYIEGKFKTREWLDRENNPRTTTELVAREVRFVDLEDSIAQAA